jgi:hypothetical protein
VPSPAPHGPRLHRLGGRRRRGCRACLRLLQRRASGAGAGGTDLPAPGREPITGPGHDDGLGSGDGGVEGRLPGRRAGLGLDADGCAEHGVERGADLRVPRPDVVPDGVADAVRRGGHAAPVHAERQHGTGAGLVQDLERHPGAARAAAHHHRGEDRPERRLHRQLPAGIDLDHVEEGAERALDVPEALGAGAGACRVEGLAERLGPRRPGVALGVCRPARRLGVLQRHLGLGPCRGRGLPRGGERRDGRLGVGQRRPQPLGLGSRPLDPCVERRQARRGPAHLAAGPVRGPAQGGELTPHLGGPALGCRRVVAPPLAERRALGGQRLLDRLEPLGLGQEGDRRRLRLVELAPKAGAVGLEAGDDLPVDGDREVPLDPPPALGQHRRQPPCAGRRPLEADEAVAEVLGAHGGQLRLRGQHRQVQLGEASPGGGVLCAQSLPALGARPQPRAQRRQLLSCEEQADRSQLGHEVAVASGGGCLALQRAQLAAELAQQVGEAQEVGLGGLEPALGPLLAAPELEDAGRLLDDRPPVLRPGVQDPVELALADDDVLLSPDAGVGQQVLHVEEPAGDAVERVLAVAVAEQRAADGELGEGDGQLAVAVVDGQADLGPAEGGAALGAGEDDVVHLRAADGAGPLRTEDPGDGVDDVRLAGAVGADDHGDPRLEVEGGRVGEGLEALEGE